MNREIGRANYGKEIRRRKWKQQASNTTGRRCRQQPNIELGGEEWSLAYTPQGLTRLNEKEKERKR